MCLCYQAMGDDHSAYAAINLALEYWPEEFVWQITAADLSEKLGDNLNAARHRNEAEKYRFVDTEDSCELDYSDPMQIVQSISSEDQKISVRQLPEVIEYAKKLMWWGNHEMAKTIINIVEDVYGKNYKTRFLLSEIYILNREFADAEKILNPILEDTPQDEKVILLMARLYIEKGDSEYALAILDNALMERKINKSSLLSLKMRAIEKDGGLDDAVQFIRMCLEQDKTSEFLNQSVTFMLEKKNPQLAQEFSEKALQLDSRNEHTLLAAAKVASIFGDLDKALELLNRSIIKNPYIPESYILSAEIFETKRQNGFAQKILEEGMAHNPIDFDLLKFAGKYFNKIGKSKMSDKFINSAFTINPYDLEIADIVKQKDRISPEYVE